MSDSTYDAVIVGGGPAGATTGLLLARAGLRVCILEKDAHPRFHIGESILPRTTPLLRELGLQDAVSRLPQIPKYGAEFCFGNGQKTLQFRFDQGLVPGQGVFNIERSVFDKCLIDEAKAAGAEVFENTAVKAITKLSDGAVEVQTADRHVDGRLLMDCSGHGTIVGRHLNQRKNFSDPQLQKVAYFEHFQNVKRSDGQAAGYPCIVMCEEGWFWMIAINAEVTSIGLVTRPDFVKRIDVPADQLLRWAIERCPFVRERIRDATGPQDNRVLSDFSYTCRPHAGPGYFLVGDAGCFLDPIFSTGVTLAMMGAREASARAIEVLRGITSAAQARDRYIRFIDSSTGPFWRLIRGYYRHSFRELFMNGSGPMEVHRAVISILAGQVFPKPAWPLRWRLRLFEMFVRLQEWVPLVPRHPPFSLVNEPPVTLAPAELASAGS